MLCTKSLRRTTKPPNDSVGADRIFLRIPGGGYIFIHRILIEYFAALETELSADKDK